MNRTVAVRDVGGKRFSEFELYHRPTEGTQTRMTAEQYRQMAESLPEKKTFGGVSMLSSGGSSRYGSSLPPKGTSYGMGEQPPVEPRKWEQKQETPIKTENETAEKAIDDIAEAPPAAAEKPELAPQEPEREAAAAERAVPDEHEPESIEEAPTVAGEEETTEPEYRLIGEVFATYLLAEHGNELLLIDKHAAHERILFNRLKRQHRSGRVERQMLLVPLTVELAREQYDAAMQNPDCFERAGFAVEDFGEGCLRVREVPSVLEDVPAEDLLCELCERLLQRGGMDEEAIYDELYHSVACKAAIKGNIPSMEQEQQELLRLLKEDPTVRNCPHGRPVAVVITRRELERMFGRIV